ILPLAGLVEEAGGDDVELSHLVPAGALLLRRAAPRCRADVLLAPGLLRLELVTAVEVLLPAAKVFALHLQVEAGADQPEVGLAILVAPLDHGEEPGLPVDLQDLVEEPLGEL